MRFKVTKATPGAETDNKLKHLYGDPAFSPDPTSNPLCAASHDISSWVADPPKGHPLIRSSREARASEVILIQPPNSPVYTKPIMPLMLIHSQIPVSVPDLSSTASSASDSSLPASSASHSSTSLTALPSAPPTTGSKKRIDLPFFRRKTLPMPNTPSQTHPSSVQIQRRINRAPKLNGSSPSQSAAGKARELDMIDELDETNPLGVALHHGGPYEAIKRMVHPGPQPQRAYRPNQQFRFDVSLNLSPGQFLPHSVTPYYRPHTLGPVRNIQQRLRLGPSADQEQVGQSATNEPVTKQYSTDVPSSAPDHMDHKSLYSPPHAYRHVSSDPAIVLDTNRFPGRPPLVGHSTNESTLTRDVMVTAQRMAHASANDGSWKQHVAEPIDPRVTPRWNAEEHRQNSPHSSQRALPVQEEYISPPVQNHYRHQELRQAPSREASDSHPSVASSSSSIHSGTSSAITGMTGTTVSSRKRILPRQLVMPAPLAKAAISSRPQPTHPQHQLHWQNTPRQHRIRFGDGMEYELPVTNMEPTVTIPVVPTPKLPTRTTSLSSNGKLKKQHSFRGPEPPEIVARLAAAKAVLHKGKYMEPPPTIPEPPRIDPPVWKKPVKGDMRRLLSKRR